MIQDIDPRVLIAVAVLAIAVVLLCVYLTFTERRK